MKQIHFLYAIRPPAVRIAFIAASEDEEALFDLCEAQGLSGVRLMSPEDNRRETADWFIENTNPPVF